MVRENERFLFEINKDYGNLKLLNGDLTINIAVENKINYYTIPTKNIDIAWELQFYNL
jgi:hypothetical protein